MDFAIFVKGRFTKRDPEVCHKSLVHQKKLSKKYYLIGLGQPRVYGIFGTVPECKDALLKAEWEISYMIDGISDEINQRPEPMPLDTKTAKRHIKRALKEGWESDEEFVMLMYGHIAIEIVPVYDATDMMCITKDAHDMCLEQLCPGLEYVDTYSIF